VPKADHTALLRRRGKAHTYVSITPGAWNPATNTVASATEATATAYGVFQHSRETAIAGVAIVEGDELLLLEAQALQDVSIVPKSGDALVYAGGATYRRAIVALDPMRGTDADIWMYRLLLRGPIDAE
jgi:hypothetical protein